MCAAAFSSSAPNASLEKALLPVPQSTVSFVTSFSMIKRSLGERPVRLPVLTTRAPEPETIPSLLRTDASTRRAGGRFSCTAPTFSTPKRPSVILRTARSIVHPFTQSNPTRRTHGQGLFPLALGILAKQVSPRL